VSGGSWCPPPDESRQMSLHGLLDAVVKDPALAEAVKAAEGGNRMHVDLVGPPAARPFAVAAMARETGRPVLAVTATGREAEDLAAALRTLLPSDGVVEFPSWETLPHERLSPRSDTVGRRLAVLRRLAHPSPDDPETGPVSVVVAPVRSVLQPQVKGLGDLEPVALRTGRTADLNDVVEALAAAAYARVELVEKRGEFAVRGGILDVFPPTEEHPLRVEFWGDDIEEIRYFKVADQRSLEVAEHGLWAPPCRELLLTDDVRARARALAEEHPELGELLGRIAEGIAVEGMESLAPVLVDDMELLLDVLPKGAMALVCDPERVRTRAADLVATSQEFLQASWAATAGGGEAPIDVGAASLWSIADVRERARELDMMWWSVSPFAADLELEADTLKLGMHAPETYRGDTAKALADTKGWLADGWRTVYVTEGHGPAARTVEVLGGEGIAARLDAELDTISPSVVHVACGSIEYGFVDPALRLAVLTETDLSGQKAAGKDGARMPARRRKSIDPLTLERATTSSTSSTAWAATSRWCSAPSRAPPASTWSSSTPPPSAASPATGSTSPPTSWSRSPSTSAGRRPPCTAWAAPTGPRPRRAPRRPSRRSRPTSSSSTARAWRRPATPSARTPPGSASWRTPSRTWRRPTSSPPSPRSRRTWRSRSRWTA
jgi:transcription-repair coupling factor (superfamily II helicase)